MLLLRAGVVFTFYASAVYCERLTPAGENALYETYEMPVFIDIYPVLGFFCGYLISLSFSFNFR